MAFAQPAVKDNFLYNGDLYVDVGNLNRHKRASVAEITKILRPDLKKLKDGQPVKDPVGHWYEAQLIHYGLPPSKDKARAKMRLLENLNNSNLKVPANIAGVESDLKKEFAAAERKAKAQHKASIASSESANPKATVSKKRKAADTGSPAPHVNININFGSGTPSSFGSVPAEGQDRPAPAKRPKQTARRSRPFHGTPPGSSHPPDPYNQSPPPTPRPKQTARRGGGAGGSKLTSTRPSAQQSMNTVYSNDFNDRSASPPARPKQTARRSKPPGTKLTSSRSMPQQNNYDAESSGPPPVSVKESKVRKETKPKAEPKIKQEKPIKNEPKAKKEPNIKQETQPTAPSLGLINGIYDITCSAIEDEWNCRDLTLILTLDSQMIWGAYDFDMFQGIMHFPQRPYSAGQNVGFQWRGRDTSEGVMSFGDGNDGEISFLGGGEITGWINVYGQCEFQGVRRGNSTTHERSALSMRNEWDGYNEDAYERERVGRWGGGGAW